MEVISERTYIRKSYAACFIPYGKRLDENGAVKDPDSILKTLQRVVDREVKRRKGVRGTSTPHIQMDYRTGVPVFAVRCRMIEDVPESDRARVQEWMDKISQDQVVAGFGKFKVSSNG